MNILWVLAEKSRDLLLQALLKERPNTLDLQQTYDPLTSMFLSVLSPSLFVALFYLFILYRQGTIYILDRYMPVCDELKKTNATGYSEVLFERV